MCRAYTLRECSLISLRGTWFPPSLPSPLVSSSLPAPTPHPSTSSKNIPPPARLTRTKVGSILPLFVALCKRRKDRCTPLEPHPVRRLPRLSPCHLCHLCQAAASAEAEATSCPKRHRPISLTHAPASCRKSPASHARTGH